MVLELSIGAHGICGPRGKTALMLTVCEGVKRGWERGVGPKIAIAPCEAGADTKAVDGDSMTVLGHAERGEFKGAAEFLHGECA